MNENLNLCEVLKDAPKGLKLWSNILGDVYILRVALHGYKEPNIQVRTDGSHTFYFDKNGCLELGGEPCLWPSKDQRDWNKFEIPKSMTERFDPKTFQPFDRVLGKESCLGRWYPDIFSLIEARGYRKYCCITNRYEYCIPYNDDTKHLAGTTDEAPWYYRYWEDKTIIN